MIWLILLAFMFCECFARDDTFTEELYIRDLGKGFVSLHFNFNILQKSDEKLYIQHYHLFPRSMGEILCKYDVSELHLSLVRGFWDANEWGYPHTYEAPGAAELWAWFSPKVRHVDRTWKSLTNALSGHFCTSLNFLGETQAFAAPRWSYRPVGLSAPAWAQASSRFLRHAQLPRETVCTENLTPWLKLLPCKQRAGLAQLLNPMKLYTTHYHAMTVHVRHVCADPACDTMGLELRQTLSLVFDRRLHAYGLNDWSLERLLSRSVSTPCPLAERSSVLVEVPFSAFSLRPHPSVIHRRSEQEPMIYEYDIKKGVGISVTYPANRQRIRTAPALPPTVWDRVPVSVEKFSTGMGNLEGGVRCIITNRDPNHHLRAVYMDVIPWYLRIQYRTVLVTVNGRSRRPMRVFYQPGRDRHRPHHLELVLDLPVNSTVEVSYSFSKALLRWTEYPPDANRGFFLPASAISFLLPRDHITLRQLQPWSTSFHDLIHNRSEFGRGKDAGRMVRLYSVPLLVSMPTPDFSMPFNALCLACTVVAIAVGTIHNFTTRVVIGVSTKPVKRSLLDRLRIMVGLRPRSIEAGKPVAGGSGDKGKAD